MVKVLALDNLFCPMGGIGRRHDSVPTFFSIFFYLTRDEIDDANSDQPLSDISHYVWKLFCPIFGTGEGAHNKGLAGV